MRKLFCFFVFAFLGACPAEKKAGPLKSETFICAFHAKSDAGEEKVLFGATGCSETFNKLMEKNPELEIHSIVPLVKKVSGEETTETTDLMIVYRAVGQYATKAPTY